MGKSRTQRGTKKGHKRRLDRDGAKKEDMAEDASDEKEVDERLDVMGFDHAGARNGVFSQGRAILQKLPQLMEIIDIPLFFDEIVAMGPQVVESFVGDNTYFLDKTADYTSAWIQFFKGNHAFQDGDFKEALTCFIESIVAFLRVSESLDVAISDPDEMGIREFDFHGRFSDDVSEEKEARLVHQIAICTRNAGLALFKLQFYSTAQLFFDLCSQFRTLNMETKTHFWRCAALMKLGRYADATSAIELAETLAKEQNLSERLLFKNEKMRRSKHFAVIRKCCYRMSDEFTTGRYELEKMFSEKKDFWLEHAEFNCMDQIVGRSSELNSIKPNEVVSGATTSSSEPVTGNGQKKKKKKKKKSKQVDIHPSTTPTSMPRLPGIFAGKDYVKGSLIFVSRAYFSSPASDIDADLLPYSQTDHSALFEPIHLELTERRKTTRHDEIFQRFYKYLLNVVSKDVTERNKLEQTCVQIAERIGAVGRDGEIDHEQVANELLKQEELRTDLLEKHLHEHANSPCRLALQAFCKQRKLQEFIPVSASDLDLDVFIESSIRCPGLDPTGDALEELCNRDPTLKFAILGLLEGRVVKDVTSLVAGSSTKPATLSEQEKVLVRRAGLLFRDRSFLFANGAEFLWHREGCELEDIPVRTCIWGLPSMLNHSCVPNAAKIAMGDLCFVQALEDIKQGEELTICYTNLVYKDRNILQERWGFRCTCEFCQKGGPMPQDEAISKWIDVLLTKVLPKFTSGANVSVLEKHCAYASKLLDKLSILVRNWLTAQTFINPRVPSLFFRALYIEPYYSFVNVLEQQGEMALRNFAMIMRKNRIMHDSKLQFGLIALVCKRALSLHNDRDYANYLLPKETEEIFARILPGPTVHKSTSLVSSTLRALLYVLDYPCAQPTNSPHDETRSLPSSSYHS